MGASERKLRLFACGCCRRIWHLIDVGPARDAIVVSEYFADECCSEVVLKAANQKAAGQVVDVPEYDAYWADPACMVSMEDAWESARCVEHVVMVKTRTEWKISRAFNSALIRDVFGNPFRPVTLDPSWRTSTVLALAQQMYDSRDFSDMPILADALQDASCENADILNHCRGDGPHVRGCWVVDLILGKE